MEDLGGIETTNRIQLLDLPWADVLHTHLFPKLTLKSLFSVRVLSRSAHACVADYFQSCQCLDLTGVGKKFSRHCFQLVTTNNTSYRIVSVSAAKSWLEDKDLIPVIEQNPFLVELDISCCTALSSRSLYSLTAHCPRLMMLNLDGCNWLSTECLCNISRSIPTIRGLILSGCWSVDDRAISVLAAECPELRVLSLSRIYSITDQSLFALALKCRSLIALDFRGCWRITDNGIQTIAEYCRRLQRLKVQDCRSVTEISLSPIRLSGVSVDVPRPKYSLEPQFNQFVQQLKLQI